MIKKIHSRKFFIILLGSLIVVYALVCFFVFDGNISKHNTKTLEDVTLHLNWIHQAEFSGNYVAKEKGFYKKEGLNVNIVPFDFESNVVDLVVKEGLNFGIMGADQLIIAREKGYPVKAIAVVYKTNPAVMFSLKEKNIIRPQDFLGKNIGLEKGSNTSYLYSAMMNNLKIDRSQIKETEIGQGSDEILSGEVDVSTGYVINEPNIVKEAGKDVNVILMSDYGVHLYGDVIFTTEDLINNKPDLINRFLSATLDGWQYAIENQEEATDIVFKYSSDNSTRDHQYNMLRDSIPLVSDGVSFLGWMDKEHWQKAFDLLLSQNIISKPIEIKDLYTMDFLADYYVHKKR